MLRVSPLSLMKAFLFYVATFSLDTSFPSPYYFPRSSPVSVGRVGRVSWVSSPLLWRSLMGGCHLAERRGFRATEEGEGDAPAGEEKAISRYVV